MCVLCMLDPRTVMQKEDFVIFSHFSDHLVLKLSLLLMQLEEAEEGALVKEGGEEGQEAAAAAATLEKNITKLAAQFTNFQAEAMPILQKYMKESNSARMSHVTGVFSQREFLRGVLVGPEYGDVRAVLKDMLYSSP
jgi:hypothetical protein